MNKSEGNVLLHTFRAFIF